ncbi:hypothetical protein BYT27DRAFT_7079971 [Phlegmacium glaucopus]|nr:hypothetical protein BYT27DRAFT_7079971 [Phlegmacium glaucopus]
MSSEGRRIIITQTKQSPLPTCNPNLMPFHIGHTGPAAPPNRVVQHTQPADVEMGTVLPTLTSSPSSIPSASSPNKTLSGSIQTSASTSTLVSSESIDSLIPTTSAASSSSNLFPEISSSSVLKDIDKRLISSFRGRTIHGLTVDLPTGYTGLLLQGDQPTATDHPNPCTEPATAEGSSKDLEIINDDDDTNSPDYDLEVDEGIPLRKLIPQSTFSSITLWHADRAVDETRDEYYRTLTEWMALSHEVRIPFNSNLEWVLMKMKRFIDSSNGLVELSTANYSSSIQPISHVVLCIINLICITIAR